MVTEGPGLPPLSLSREEFRPLDTRGDLVSIYAQVSGEPDTPFSQGLRLDSIALSLKAPEPGEDPRRNFRAIPIPWAA
jgi:hypothetical protein